MAQPHYKLKYTGLSPLSYLLSFIKKKKRISSKRADLMTFTGLFFPQWQVMTMCHDVKPCVVLIIYLTLGKFHISIIAPHKHTFL